MLLEQLRRIFQVAISGPGAALARQRPLADSLAAWGRRYQPTFRTPEPPSGSAQTPKGGDSPQVPYEHSAPQGSTGRHLVDRFIR